MARYNPTPEEIAALVAAGWRHAPEQGRDWFWPPNELGYGYTYTEAVREQRRREKAQEATRSSRNVQTGPRRVDRDARGGKMIPENQLVEVEEDGTPYDAVCEHGVHFGGYRCWTCHPELQSCASWLFTPEMDAAYEAHKGTNTP